MIVKSIECSGFMRVDPAPRRMALPTSGVVLVKGPNGSGKSTWVEAVSYACWGRLLRDPGGTVVTPWGAGTGYVRATVDAGGVIVHVTRTVNARGRESLTWAIGDAPPATYETTTKAQAALARVIGPWDAWARTHVFSSEDSVALSKAKDGVVKGLLERVFGLDRYDLAHRDAADAATQKNRDLATYRREAETAKAHTAAADARRVAASAAVADLGVARVVTAEDVATAKAAAETFAAQAKAKLDHADAVVRASADVAAARRESLIANTSKREAVAAELAAVRDSACGACGRPFADAAQRDAHKREIQARAATLDAEHAALAAAEREARDAHTSTAASLAELRQKINAKNLHLGARVAELRSAAEHEARTTAARDALTRAEADAIEAYRAALRAEVAATEALVEADLDALTQTVVVAVLGPKGMRASVLAAGLEGLTAQVNPWLQKFPGKAERLRIEQGTKANGDPTGEIVIVLEGCGGRDPRAGSYEGSSAGERRRVDLAMLFALAETAGDGRGTLFLDECFDKLDSAARQPLREILAELARDRCVVVVSHAPEVITTLRPDHVVDLAVL